MYAIRIGRGQKPSGFAHILFVRDFDIFGCFMKSEVVLANRSSLGHWSSRYTCVGQREDEKSDEETHRTIRREKKTILFLDRARD